MRCLLCLRSIQRHTHTHNFYVYSFSSKFPLFLQFVVYLTLGGPFLLPVGVVHLNIFRKHLCSSILMYNTIRVSAFDYISSLSNYCITCFEYFLHAPAPCRQVIYLMCFLSVLNFVLFSTHISATYTVTVYKVALNIGFFFYFEFHYSKNVERNICTVLRTFPKQAAENR